ncbi:hypothetical protein, conserved, partial [Leishmania donovani]
MNDCEESERGTGRANHGRASFKSDTLSFFGLLPLTSRSAEKKKSDGRVESESRCVCCKTTQPHLRFCGCREERQVSDRILHCAVVPQTIE